MLQSTISFTLRNAPYRLSDVWIDKLNHIVMKFLIMMGGWIYKNEILEYIDICLYKIDAIRKAINLHNINVGVSLALLHKSN